MQPENIIIRRRRKRWSPSEPRLDESYMAPPDTILPNLPVIELPTSGGFTPRGMLTLENPEQTGELGEKNSALSESCSPPLAIPAPQAAGSHEAQSITVHQFLQDMTKKPGRKYGRRNQVAAVEFVGVYRSEGSISSHISCDDDDCQSGQGVSTPHRAHHVQLRHPYRRVRHRQKKLVAKPLAQRLFEADVFSSGAFSRPTAQDDPAHTSTRRPLQFITSLNLTPSLEARVCQRRRVTAGGSSPTRTLAVSDSPSATVAPGRAPDRNTLVTRGARIGGGSGAFLTSGKRVLRTRGGKQGMARSPAGPFEFVPLPLVRVKTHQGAVQSQYPVIRSRPNAAYTKRQSEFNLRPPLAP